MHDLLYSDDNACTANSTCENTYGSYKCPCKTGFWSVLGSCTEVNECKEKSHNCHFSADCRNTVGSYECTCKEGFYGNGRMCEDVDECKAKARFLSTIGSTDIRKTGNFSPGNF